jgi:large subunit ribosomal protein L7/L12
MCGCCIEIIIMSSETNAFQVGTPSPDEFRWLLRRYLVLVSQLGLASKDFGDLSGLPKEHVAAALVVQEASAELQALHCKLHEWYARQNNAPKAIAASATEAAAAISPAVSLVLKEYALDRKVNVIRVVREIVPGCSLTTAKALVERELPIHIADWLAPEEAVAMRQKFEAVGAVCIIAAMTSRTTALNGRDTLA